MLGQAVVNLLRLVVQLFGEGQHRGLERRERRMQVHDHAGVLLFCIDHLFVVCVAEEGQSHTVRAEGRLHHIGDVALVGLLVEIFQALAGVLLMLLEVVVRAVCNAPELAPAEREQVLDVCGGLGIEGKLLFGVVAQAHVLFRHAEGQQPVAAEAAPVFEPFQIGARLAEEFAFHLLKFTDTEDKVARRDLIAEALSHLAYAEGDLFARGALDVVEVYEDALGGFRAEVEFIFCILRHALERLKHQVELADVRKVGGTAVRAFDVVLFDEIHHLLVAPTVRRFPGEVLDQFIGTMARFAIAAVHQRVGEAAHMAGSHPDLRVHQDCGVQTDVGGAFLDELLPPSPFHIVLKLHTERAVIPGIG